MGAELPELTIRFVESSVTVDRDDPDGLVFGRGAQLDIDSNPFMHRQVGRFVAHDGMWWLENLGSWTTIRVLAEGASALLPGGGRAVLTSKESLVCFIAGTCNYELHASMPRVPVLPTAAAATDTRTATFEPVSVPLSDEQRLLVVALAERRLRQPEDRYRLASNRDLARRLGWSDAKFNRKLDHLCQRLSRLGVSGMRTDAGRANDRRLHLVSHMVDGGHVTAADLVLLEEYPLPGQ